MRDWIKEVLKKIAQAKLMQLYNKGLAWVIRKKF